MMENECFFFIIIYRQDFCLYGVFTLHGTSGYSATGPTALRDFSNPLMEWPRIEPAPPRWQASTKPTTPLTGSRQDFDRPYEENKKKFWKEVRRVRKGGWRMEETVKDVNGQLLR